MRFLASIPLMRTWRSQDLELREHLRHRLAVGPDEPRLGLATGLEANQHLLAGLLGGDLDRRSPLVVGVEEGDASGLFRVDPVQLEEAIAGVEREIAAPDEVGVLDVERGDNHRVLDRLVVWPDYAALDGLARPQHGGDLVRLVAGLDLVGDDVVGVMAHSAGLTIDRSYGCQSPRGYSRTWGRRRTGAPCPAVR